MPPPDWRKWRHVAKLSAEEAVALTMNFCPKTIKEILAEVSWSGSPALFSLVASASGMDFEDATEFERRLSILERSLEPIPATVDLEMLARRFEWGNIPAELANLAHQAAAESAGTLTTTSEARSKRKDAAEPSKRERQIQAIVEMALAQGFDVLSIPRGGKSTIRTQCMKTLPLLFGAGPDPFKEAWQEALDQNRVRTADHDRYVNN
jgi:hypothetical protein